MTEISILSVVLAVVGVPVGLALANVVEWFIHRFVLHGLGKRRASFWSFHWHEHHAACRKGGMLDPDYERFPLGVHAQGKEVLGLCWGALTGAVIIPWWPTFGATLVWSAWDYYRKHKRAHQDVEWGRQHLPWHYDHHMGPDQNRNWCVTHPWFDVLVGTRDPYVGTALEAERRAAGRF